MSSKPDHINWQTGEDLGGHKGRVLGMRQRLICQNQKRGEEFMNRELKLYSAYLTLTWEPLLIPVGKARQAPRKGRNKPPFLCLAWRLVRLQRGYLG